MISQTVRIFVIVFFSSLILSFMFVVFCVTCRNCYDCTHLHTQVARSFMHAHRHTTPILLKLIIASLTEM